MVDIQSPTAENRGGKKKKREEATGAKPNDNLYSPKYTIGSRQIEE